MGGFAVAMDLPGQGTLLSGRGCGGFPYMEARPSGIARTAVRIREDGDFLTGRTLWSTPLGTRHDGYTYNSGLDEFEGDEIIYFSSQQTKELEAHLFAFEDSTFDVDANGRFNALDITALTALISTTNPDVIRDFDQDNDADIDAADVAVLQGYVDADLDSGLFGDFNRDGVVSWRDCGGYGGFGYTLDDAGYVITLDFDLDGDTDSSDEAAFAAAVANPDLNGDNNLDGFDIQCMELLVGGPNSCSTQDPDFNRDGNVDGFDVQDVEEAVGTGC